MTRQRTLVILKSAPAVCPVCVGDVSMSLHFPGARVDYGFVGTACLHCTPIALPVVVLPAYQDKRKAS